MGFVRNLSIFPKWLAIRAEAYIVELNGPPHKGVSGQKFPTNSITIAT